MNARARQRGAALFAALAILVIMMLGAAALMRMIDAGTILSGNLAFKRATINAADTGTEAAIGWLQKQKPSDLQNDQPDNGYYASLAAENTVIDWNDDACAGAKPCRKSAGAIGPDAAGNVVRYLVQRLCRTAGPPQSAINDCHVDVANGSSNRGAFSYGANKRFAADPAVYYRITTRAAGPRHTVSITDVLVRY